MNAVAEVRYLSIPQLNQVDTRFDPEFGVYWAFMNPKPRACFTTQLLQELHGYINSITENNGVILHDGEMHKIRYGVLASKLATSLQPGRRLVVVSVCDKERGSGSVSRVW